MHKKIMFSNESCIGKPLDFKLNGCNLKKKYKKTYKN